MEKPPICPENSAQGTNSKPNPLVRPVLEKLTNDKRFVLKRNIKIADLGCGKLRHLAICREFSKHILLIDTKLQIERTQKFAGLPATMSQYVESLGDRGTRVRIVDINDFEKQQNNADIVLSVAVMDVVIQDARIRMARAAFRNLRPGGYFVVIVPRNDSSILVNCRQDNRFEDGFLFRNRGHDNLTFYTNFRDTRLLLDLLNESGFHLVEDISVFRQVCFILRKVKCP